MTAADLLAALALPAATRVDQRVPKKLLLENGAPTAADKRAITEGLEECRWLAALKPHTIGVPAYQDAEREYLEIHVLHMSLRPDSKAARLVELVHRAVPYPVLLVHSFSDSPAPPSLSGAHKRHSHLEKGKVVLDDAPVVVDLAAPVATDHRDAFAAALALLKQPQGSLYTLYSGWLDTLLSLVAAGRTGRFSMPATPAAAAARREALAVCVSLEADIQKIRAAASRETQVAKQAELNHQLNAARTALATATANL